MTTSQDDEFFVGYLALPHGLKRRTLLSGALALAGLLVASLVLARNTAGAGAAHFAFANAQGTLGVLTTQPTPLVWTLDAAAPGGVRGTLLVRQGKFGLGKASAAMDGHVVHVTGTSIERDGQRLIEVSALPVLADDALPAPEHVQNPEAMLVASVLAGLAWRAIKDLPHTQRFVPRRRALLVADPGGHAARLAQ